MDREALILLAIIVGSLFFLWPREGWRNEWSSNGECLAWRVQRYGLIERELRGPFVVESRWCRWVMSMPARR